MVTEGKGSTRTAALAWAGAAALGVLGGCTLITDSFLTNDFSGDPYPIDVETSSGAIVVGMRQTADTEDRIAVLDLLSPFTVIDQDAKLAPSVSYADLTLLGKAPPGDPLGGPVDLSTARPRARFTDARVISLHPCAIESTPCTVGPTGTRPFAGIIGADVLAGDAVRLRLGDNQIFVLPDIGGGDRDRSLDCDAVFDSPYRGGGTLVIAKTELPFGNRRITLQSCLGPDPDPTRPQSQRGADALLVMSTSIGISILGEAAYERYRDAHVDPVTNAKPPELALLPEDSVYLPSGQVTGRRANISGVALVAASSSNALAPCRRVYAHHVLACNPPLPNSPPATTDDWPCEDDSGFCAVPAVLELTPPAGVDVLVVSDTEPTLQALRTELRPDQPEVDGILGTNALRGVEIDVDYPHDRLLARCPGGNCSARPQLAQPEDRTQINNCISGQQDQPAIPLCTIPPPES
jgi:hypothetical protein